MRTGLPQPLPLGLPQPLPAVGAPGYVPTNRAGRSVRGAKPSHAPPSAGSVLAREYP